jgi:hypothetical protein
LATRGGFAFQQNYPFTEEVERYLDSCLLNLRGALHYHVQFQAQRRGVIRIILNARGSFASYNLVAPLQCIKRSQQILLGGSLASYTVRLLLFKVTILLVLGYILLGIAASTVSTLLSSFAVAIPVAATRCLGRILEDQGASRT